MNNHSYVINLTHNTERLNTFLTFLPEKFRGDLTIFSAVYGDRCRHPAWWNAGSGAWGCYRSHVQILEQVMSANLPYYIVFEDDAVFDKNFNYKYDKFIDALPVDWDMFYLGGQLIHAEEEINAPEYVNPEVYRPYNVNRTHCFAVNNKAFTYFYDFLLRRFEDRQWHIDHHLGRLHEQKNFNVYCPPEWIVGQGEGMSGIKGEHFPERYFPHPITYLAHKNGMNTCVILDAPIHVVRELINKHNWHCGYNLDDNCIDSGLQEMNGNPINAVRKWWYYIKREAIESSKTPFLYCPHKQLDNIDLPFLPLRLNVCSVEEALKLGK